MANLFRCGGGNMQEGSSSFSGNTGTNNVTFPKAFPSVPTVKLSPSWYFGYESVTVTTTGFSFVWQRREAGESADVLYWVAYLK